MCVWAGLSEWACFGGFFLLVYGSWVKKTSQENKIISTLTRISAQDSYLPFVDRTRQT